MNIIHVTYFRDSVLVVVVGMINKLNYLEHRSESETLSVFQGD